MQANLRFFGAVLTMLIVALNESRTERLALVGALILVGIVHRIVATRRIRQEAIAEIREATERHMTEPSDPPAP